MLTFVLVTWLYGTSFSFCFPFLIIVKPDCSLLLGMIASIFYRFAQISRAETRIFLNFVQFGLDFDSASLICRPCSDV